MCQKCHQCTVTVETLTNAGVITLPNVQRIRTNPVLGINVRRSGSLTLKTKTGKTVAADTVIATAHLQLVDQQGFVVVDEPLSNFQRDYNSPEPRCVNYQNIDMEKSNITMDTGATGYSATAAIEITFEIACDQCFAA
jgi:hypothetical protein